MKINYLSYAQATAICEDYQHLAGNLFNTKNEEEGIIKQVVVAPYSRILQWKFVRLLLRGADHATALSITPNGRFDVLILPDQSARDTLSYRVKSVRCYLREQEAEFDFDRYNVLRTI